MENQFNKRVLRVPTSSVRVNTWNPNRLTESQIRALSESIEEFTDLDFILVRPSGTEGQPWEIVDGENRFRVLSAKGETEVDVVAADLSDAQARKYTLIANSHGQNSENELATLLSNLRESYGEGFGTGLMIEQGELTRLAEHGSQLLANLGKAGGEDANEAPAKPQDEPSASESWESIRCSVPTSVAELWAEVRRSVAKRLEEYGDKPINKNPQVGNGQVLEFIIAEYMATNG